LTIYEPGTLQNLQIQGTAEVETDQKVKDSVFALSVRPRAYKDKTLLPLITKLQEVSFMAVRISASIMSYHDYCKD
jgi:hypothetical protein